MAEIVAVGNPEFALGFQLAGVKETIEIEGSAEDKIKEILQSRQIGILIVDQKTVDKLNEHTRFRLESSIQPVAVVVSTEDYSGGLRKMIKQSIGVDLWKKEN